MIDLYTAPTFNGQRVSIMLEETGLPYTLHLIHLGRGEQRTPEFLQLNPSGRIPVLVDGDAGSHRPLILTQSVAIVQYLAEKTGQLLPTSLNQRAKMYEWMQFHAIDIGATLFNAFYLTRHITPGHPQAAERLKSRVHELYAHFDDRLSRQAFLAGPEYTLADIIVLPAALAQADKLGNYRHLTRWLQQLGQRSSVRRGMAAAAREAGHEN